MISPAASDQSRALGIVWQVAQSAGEAGAEQGPNVILDEAEEIRQRVKDPQAGQHVANAL